MKSNNSTFNTVSIGTVAELGGHFPVWARIEDRRAGGGYFDLSKTNPLTGEKFKAGDLIPAGTMLKYTGPGGELTILKSGEEAAQCNGLLDNDVCIPENCVSASGAVVTKGRIYADRVWNGTTWGLPAEVEAKLPMIEFVRE